ncbi:hypothetical protein D9757_000562 [Collybiopsis confluens]|uniref:Uncharacterized protein n=1 Tax=Collybiopsis confluens TaxID=2823264 RepID=A0A8H5MGM2_9AGAR|nr:hypothetical protein D9757_000562 [Collybiopsis confluens]
MSKNKKAKRDKAARDAIKKKRKLDPRASKYKNAQLKAVLDGQAHLLYIVTPGSTLEMPPPTEANVQELTDALGDL